jgi:hypothetical protein
MNRGSSHWLVALGFLVTALLSCGDDEGRSTDDDGGSTTAGSSSVGSGGSAGAPSSSSSSGTGGCAAGTADCNADPSDGCEATLDSSADHCGECDHSCLGGECMGALCQPLRLTPVTGFAADGLVVDATHVYYVTQVIDTGEVSRVSKLGGDPEPIAPLTSSFSYHSMRLTPTHVWWIEGSSSYGTEIVRAPLAGGAPEVFVTGITSEDYAVDTQNVYYRDGSFLRIQPLAGGPLQSYSFGTGSPGPLGQDADHVYNCTYGTIVRMHKSTHAVETVVTNGGTQTCRELETLDGYVYWSQLPIVGPSNVCAPPGSIRRASIATGVQEPLGDVSEPFYMSVGDNGVYTVGCTMVNGNDQPAIYFLSLTGVPPAMLSQVTGYPARVVSDDDAIYYVDGSSVFKLAK